MTLHLNTISPEFGSHIKSARVGRGIGSGLGKTCGRGHKGQKARRQLSKLNFEGGQTPLHRRMPKAGFKSKLAQYYQELKVSILNHIDSEDVDLDLLKQLKIIKQDIKIVKIIAGEPLLKKINIKGVRVTQSVRDQIIALGGTCDNMV